MKNKIFPYSLIVLYVIILGFTTRLGAQSFITKNTFLIEAGNNDAEESEAGVLDFESSDLELVDESSNQTVGLRFTNINLPQGTVVSKAYIQFTVDEETSGVCELYISGEMSTDAEAFSDVDYNISSRLRTSSSLLWLPSDWNTINESGSAQQTINFSSVIQEIVNQDGWSSGNALVLIFTGTGTRTAVSYNKNPEWAPKLVVETESPVVDVPLENIFVNELMAKNSTYFDEYGEADDWIELYNGNDDPVYVGGIYLSDDPGEPAKWQLKSPVTIPAKGFTLIWADKDIQQGPLHANFKLSGSGESVVVSQKLDGQMILLDRVDFGVMEENISYGRKTDGTDQWIMFEQPSPNASNNNSKPLLKEPEISLQSGIFNTAQQVVITPAQEDVTIYYSLDGSIPDSGSTLYTEPFDIDSTTLLKVVSYKNDYAPSKLVERFYLFDYHSRLPVFCISTAPENLWDDSIGIYVEGTNGTTHPNYDIPSNFFQPWERPGTVMMLEPDGSLAFHEHVGIKLSGNDSKKFVQKSFGLHFRKKYGTNGVFYKVFDNIDITEFQHLKLRNSGQDYLSTLMRDGLNHSLLQGVVDIDLMAYRPAVLYLNGEYWGLYGLRESLTDDYIDTHFTVDKSSIDLLTRDGEIIVEEGSDSDYWDLYSFIENHNMADQGNYNEVSERIEINELINYQIAEIYFANFDWPDNNQRMWRANGTKWRWMMYDTDCSTNYGEWGDAYSSFNSLEFTTDPYSYEWPNNAESSQIFRGLLQNEGFKEEFVQRTCTYITLVFNRERVNHLVDSLTGLIGTEMDREIERWWKDYPDFGLPAAACGGSIAAWQTNIQDYKDYFAERPAYMMNHMKSKFNNYNTYLLHFNYPSDTKGRLYINTNEFEIPYNYTAEYFSNYKLRIKAVADSGYVFVKWLETGDTSATINFVGNEATILTPVFVDEGSAGLNKDERFANYQITLFPNPASSESVQLNINGLNAGEELQLRIYNTMGQQTGQRMLISKSDILNVSINIADWKSGIYFLKLQGVRSQSTIKLLVTK